jgi:hypothetical protein
VRHIVTDLGTVERDQFGAPWRLVNAFEAVDDVELGDSVARVCRWPLQRNTVTKVVPVTTAERNLLRTLDPESDFIGGH